MTASVVDTKWDRLAELLATTDVDATQRWDETARPEQIPPMHLGWRWWLACAGRGWGKTRACAEWIASMARRYPGARCALIAQTFGDGRDAMVEGESGLLAVFDPWELRGGSVDTAWNRSMGELYLANGSSFKIFSSEKPRALRGKQFHFIWGDEPAYWEDAKSGTVKDTTFFQANIALRLPARKGWDNEFKARGVLATTPRRVALMKVPDAVVAEHPERAGLLQRTDTFVARGKTMDNVHNLTKDYYDEVVAPLLGTEMGRQELDAELVEDVEGALWRQAQIDADRVQPDAVPILRSRVVCFDPAGGAGAGHDEQGIIVAGATGQRPAVDVYVLADMSKNCTPTEAARTALLATVEYEAHTVVYEKNQGQDWIPTVLAQVWQQLIDEGLASGPPPAFRPVNATQSKKLRAQPVATMSEQHRVHHVGVLDELEAQQTTWVAKEDSGKDVDSPDRLDAFVHAATWLYDHSAGSTAASPVGIAASVGSMRMPAVPFRTR